MFSFVDKNEIFLNGPSSNNCTTESKILHNVFQTITRSQVEQIASAALYLFISLK